MTKKKKTSRPAPHRTEVAQRRRRAHEEERSRIGAAEKQAAEERATEMRLAFARHRRTKVLGWSLLGLAVMVAVSHALDHGGAFHIFSNQGLEDLTVGYPMAGLLALGAVVLLGQLGPADRR